MKVFALLLGQTCSEYDIDVFITCLCVVCLVCDFSFLRDIHLEPLTDYARHGVSYSKS